MIPVNQYIGYLFSTNRISDLMNILKVNLRNPDSEVIERATDILQHGGLVVYPTDTTYGLGANAQDERIVRKVYNVKVRSFSKPTHVVVRDWEMIEELTHVNRPAKKLYEEYLPGPLTLILPKKKIVPDILTANLPTVGIRIPNNLVTHSLSRLVPFPYTTPSANKAGGKTPYSIDDVIKELDISKIDLIIDAGKLPVTPPSTIIDLSVIPPLILREGPITKSQIKNVLSL